MSGIKQIRLNSIIVKNWRMALFCLLLLNFALRLFIYGHTTLFSFSDYKLYLDGVEKIHDGESIKILSGNFLFTISYIGYFAKYVLGSLNFFFVFNCLLGTLTTYFVSSFIISLSGNPLAGIVTAIILTFYTEFIVFSSVFYTPVISLFLLIIIVWLLLSYFKSLINLSFFLILTGILIVFFITFLFKPELVFFSVFLLLLSLLLYRKQRTILIRNILLVFIFVVGILLVKATGIYKRSVESVISNDFVFFGHTDYGGAGGEGSFVNPENKIRYNEALTVYCKEHGLTNPTVEDRNRFQIQEINKFITHHPLKWIKLQFTKFFRTFGVVPKLQASKYSIPDFLKVISG